MAGKRSRHPRGGLAVPFPDDDDQPAEQPAEETPESAPDPGDQGAAEPDSDDDDGGQAGDDDAPARPRRSLPHWTAPPSVQDGAGWVLGALLWMWVVLPFIRSGGKPTAVRDVLKAKFINKAADGSWLP